MFTDLQNIGRITGRTDKAQNRTTGIRRRLTDLRSASRGDTPTDVFYFDIATDSGVLSGGGFSAAQAVIEAAGGRNVLEGLDNEQLTVSWETLAAKRPDFIVVGDYGGALSYEASVRKLQTNPATRDLPAVENERFIRVPGFMMRPSPQMIVAAERLRVALEEVGFLPDSEIDVGSELSP